MPRRRLMLMVTLATVLAAREAAGDIHHLKSSSDVTTEKGSKLKLPPGYFLDEKTWQERDAELKKAQEDRTRLKAENESLRKYVNEDAIPWKTIGCAIVFGAFVGYLGHEMK